MKKHLLLLVAMVSLAVGAIACNSKSSSDSDDSRVSEFCDLLRDYARKVDAIQNAYQITEINNDFEKSVSDFKDDDTKLSKSEKKDVIDAFADFGLAIACKEYELNGTTYSDEDLKEAKRVTVETMTSLCEDCNSISDMIAVFEKIGNETIAGASTYEPASTAAAFADLINDYAIKVSAANSESQIDAIGDNFENDCSRFENENSYLSSAEKEEIIDALTGLISSMGCKYAEFEGTKVDVETQSQIETYSRNSVEQITANCTSISEIITAIANLAD